MTNLECKLDITMARAMPYMYLFEEIIEMIIKLQFTELTIVYYK